MTNKSQHMSDHTLHTEMFKTNSLKNQGHIKKIGLGPSLPGVPKCQKLLRWVD